MWCPVRRRTPYEALGAVCNLNPLPPRSGGARGGAYPLKCKHALGGVAINPARIVKARTMQAFCCADGSGAVISKHGFGDEYRAQHFRETDVRHAVNEGFDNFFARKADVSRGVDVDV